MSQSCTRVLVVDDNRDLADLVSMLLGINGYETQRAFDGSEALIVAEGFEPHAVLLDLGMPSMNGLQVAAALAQILDSRKFA